MRHQVVRRGHAFGLAIAAECDLPGLDQDPAPAGLPATYVELTDEATLVRRWGQLTGGTTPEPGPDGAAIGVDRRAGCFLAARYFGTALVAPDGAHVACAPPATSSWRWQRFLVGRALPVASVLAGYQVLHASAIELDGDVLAVSGPSGIGKTSIALQATLTGRSKFVADDVLAVELGERLRAHPGFPVTNVRLPEDDLLGGEQRAAVGTLLGRTGQQKKHYAIDRATTAGALAGFAIARRVPEDHGGVSAGRPLDPKVVLGSLFLDEVAPPERLVGQLELAARMEADVQCFYLDIGRRDSARTTAEALLRWWRSR